MELPHDGPEIERTGVFVRSKESHLVLGNGATLRVMVSMPSTS